MSLDEAVLAGPATLEQIQDFLYREAELLDEWRLLEWEALLADDAIYEIPSSGYPARIAMPSIHAHARGA